MGGGRAGVDRLPMHTYTPMVMIVSFDVITVLCYAPLGGGEERQRGMLAERGFENRVLPD